MRALMKQGCTLLVTGMLLIAGCGSSDSGKAAVNRRLSTVDSIQDMRLELARADEQVVQTQQVLDRLATQRAGDLEKTYKQFKTEITRNEAMGNQINSRASALTSDSYRQINEWNYQSRIIRDEQLRQKSLEQGEMARKQHDEMVAALNDLRGAYTNYIRALEDIEIFAANNLTPQGLAELGDQRARAAELARDLRQKMAVIDGRLDRMAGAWRPNVPLAERIRSGDAMPASIRLEQRSIFEEGIPANSPVSTDQR